MIKKLLFVVAIGTLGLSAALAAEDPAPVRIYIPQTIKVHETTLSLGAITIIRSQDEALQEKAAAVTMGRAPWASEQLGIDRQTILSRLASSGIDGSRVQLSGAEKVTIQRDLRVFKVDEITRIAEGFLQDKRPGPEGCVWRLARKIDDWTVPNATDIRIQPRLAKEDSKDQVKLELAAFSGQQELAKMEAVFKILYVSQQAVTTKPLAMGEAFTKENLRIESAAVETKPTEPWIPPYGMLAAKQLPAGTILKAGMIQPPRPVIVVRRNQSVKMVIQGYGFEMTATGEAMEDGRGGDYIKVRNTDSKRVVVAKVAFDGTVEPMGEASK